MIFLTQLTVCIFLYSLLINCNRQKKEVKTMDEIKIGKFIAERRKAKNLTQAQLAEQLYVTDRAVSKWECGRSLPDSSIMLDLCKILGITVNELLTGEELEMENYNTQAENNLLELTKQKEEADKRLLAIEVVLGIISTVFLFALIGVAVFIVYKHNELAWLAITLISFGFVVFLIGCFFAVRIEQKAGYYECKHCGYRYVPTYKQTLFAPHMGRSRYMKCPHCGKKSYHKKVISKE